MNKIIRYNYGICMAIIAIIVMMALLFTIGISSPIVNAESDNINIMDYDPFYPAQHKGVDYKLTVPSLEGRLTLKDDHKTASLFAPYTTMTSGWHDTKKLFYAPYNDKQLCWAASDTNIIAWYLDVMERQGKDVTRYDRTTDAIFNRFRDNFARDGYDPLNGLDWYFTGQFTNGAPPPNLINHDSGGYLVDVENNTADGWWNLYLDKDLGVFGNNNTKLPFVQVREGVFYEGNALYNHESFSRNIIEQLHYGPTVLDIGKENVASATHAITLWGADYDAKTGLISKLYITDSDDSVTHMVEVPVKKRPNDIGGVEIKLQPGLGMGDMSNYTMVRSSMVLYAPGVVSAKDALSEYTGTNASIDSVTSNGSDIVVSSPSISGESIEYGYSLTDNVSEVSSWQASNTFSNMAYGDYYFFARVKASQDHLAGGISNSTHFVHDVRLAIDVTNITWTIGSTMTLDIATNTSNITSILIGGDEMAKSNYRVTNNTISIATSYLDTLREGTYTIIVNAVNGSDSLTLSVENAEVEPPPTPIVPEDKPNVDAGNGDVSEDVDSGAGNNGEDNAGGAIIAPNEGTEAVDPPSNNVTIIAIVISAVVGVPLIAIIVYMVATKKDK